MKQKLVKKTLLPRQSRHGKLLSEVYIKRSTTIKENPKTGTLEQVTVTRPMYPEEIQEKRTLMVATGPTQKKGRLNNPKGDTTPTWWKETK